MNVRGGAERRSREEEQRGGGREEEAERRSREEEQRGGAERRSRGVTSGCLREQSQLNTDVNASVLVLWRRAGGERRFNTST
ncbi:hypothetical protein EYF80_055143 [Liparis tanakae]|uniref:Uncharacterized protein n=1 Tax=Liparis tanakae TaxID=230148 RepID=A0A4Z2F2G7_9TELE|nr:hypothetical protein EYF80_055143 [Liparis tanakae]